MKQECHAELFALAVSFKWHECLNGWKACYTYTAESTQTFQVLHTKIKCAHLGVSTGGLVCSCPLVNRPVLYEQLMPVVPMVVLPLLHTTDIFQLHLFGSEAINIEMPAWLLTGAVLYP